MSIDTVALVAALLGGLGVLLLVALVVTLHSLRGLRPSAGSPDAGLRLLQQEIEAARSEARRGQDDTVTAMRQELAQLGGRVGQELSQVRQAVTSQLGEGAAELNRRLEASLRLVQDAQTAVGQRLDQTARVMGDVHGRLGILGEATRRLEGLAQEITGLEQILRAPKVRGGLGELLLERLLEDILPPAHYRVQHTFQSGDRVDAVIQVGGWLVPVDSKFPLENFRRMIGEGDEERRRPLRRAFARDVRGRADEIARKYILPGEGTFDFALMYVPAENVYYEIVARDDAEGSLLAYALGRRVVPVSPNSFHAYLQVILLGLKGLRIEQNAREIVDALDHLRGVLRLFRDEFTTLGRHVTNAKNKFDETAVAVARIESRLEAIAGHQGVSELPGVAGRAGE